MSDSSLVNTIIDGFSIMSGWESFAAFLGIAYIIFAARESQWCWPLAFVSTLIYTILFWESHLPMQAFLHFYYMGMAIYGYRLWRQRDQQEDNLRITSWSFFKQLQFILIASLISYAVAIYLSQSVTSQNPYLDASITVFSVLNTWLMAKKILQNWLYWVVIDAAAIVLYVQNGFYATTVMYAMYLVLAILGFISWNKLYKQ